MEPNKMPRTRVPYFDVLKFAAMYVVVLSHCWQVSGHYRTDEISYLTNWFIGFHMPIFFVVGGMFCRRVVEGGVKDLLARVWGYLWPAAAIELAFACLVFHFVTSERTFIGYYFWRLLGVWFIWVLSCCYVILWSVNRIKRIRLRILCLTTLFVILFFLPSGGLCSRVHRLRCMLPHFLLGYYFFRNSGFWKSSLCGGLCTVAFLAAVFLEGNVITNGLGFYWIDSSVYSMGENPIVLLRLLLQILIAFCGCVSFMWAVDWCVRLLPGSVIARLQTFGTTTLGIYLLHQQIIVGLRKVGSDMPMSSLLMNICAAGLIYMGCHFCVVMKRRFVARLLGKGRG